MQQPCSRCGYISDRPARFCRQCGSALFNETDASSATTRNYAPPQAAPQYGPQFGSYPYAPQQPLEEQTPDTSPFYRPPQVPPYQIAASLQSQNSPGKWILIGLLTFLTVAVLTGATLFFLMSPKQRPAATPAAADARSIPDPPTAPPPPAAENEVTVQLEEFKYPNAKVIETAHAPMTETITMTTSDNLETVKTFYDRKFKEKFKNSNTSLTTEDDETYTYTHLSNPILNIVVEPDEDGGGKVGITIVLTDVPFPRR